MIPFNILRETADSFLLRVASTELSAPGDTSLKELFIETRKHLVDLVKEATEENAAVNIQTLDVLIQNTRILSARYEEKMGFLFTSIFNPVGMATIRKAEKLIREASAAQTVLRLLQLEERNANDPEKAFQGFIGNHWKKNLSLLEALPDGTFPLLPVRKQLVDWTTQRSIQWLIRPLGKMTPMDRDMICRLLPHINYKKLTGPQLRLVVDYHISVGKPIFDKNGISKSSVLSTVGARMIKCNLLESGRLVLLAGELMKIYSNWEEVYRVRDAIRPLDFPNNILTSRTFSLCFQLLDDGILMGERSIKGFSLNNPLSLAIADPAIPQFPDAAFKLKAAAFVLRQYRRKTLEDREVARHIYQALEAFNANDQILHPDHQKIPPQQLISLFVIFDWLVKADQEAQKEFSILYPSFSSFFEKLHKYADMGLLNAHQKGLFQVNLQNALPPLTRISLIHACGIEIRFPKRRLSSELSILKNLPPEADRFLEEHFPYAFHVKQLVNHQLSPNYSIQSNSSLDACLFTRTLRDAPSSFSKWALLCANEKKLYGSDFPVELKSWMPLSCFHTSQDINFAGRREIDDLFLESFQPPAGHGSIDLTNTPLTPDAVLRFQMKYPEIKVKYRESISLGKKLLERHQRNPDPKLHETLVQRIAPKPPRLSAEIESAFFEYCYTHQITEAADRVLAKLFIEAQNQQWIDIGEYCLARLVISTTPANLFQRWKLAKELELDALKHHCARYSVAHCLHKGIHASKFSESEMPQLIEIAKGFVEPFLEMSGPPIFIPVNFCDHFPAVDTLICQEEKEIQVNLSFLSLHSTYFERLLAFNNKQIIHLNLPAENLTLIDAFLRGDELPGSLSRRELIILIDLGDYLCIPALTIAAKRAIQNLGFLGSL